jgi:uncharacterized protein (DUF433 family)
MATTHRSRAFYGEWDPVEVPVYGVAQAARYVRMSAATLRSWFLGTTYLTAAGRRTFAPVIEPAQSVPPRLSFTNLVEAHVLMALRRAHKVPLKTIREAVEVASTEHGIERPLLASIQTAFGELFLDHYGELLHLRRVDRLVLEQFFHAHLKRVKVHETGRPYQLYPFIEPFYSMSRTPEESGQIVLDINVGFGMPTLTGVGVSTRVVSDRVDAGESVDVLAHDYEIRPEQVMAAVAFERVAA